MYIICRDRRLITESEDLRDFSPRQMFINVYRSTFNCGIRLRSCVTWLISTVGIGSFSPDSSVNTFLSVPVAVVGRFVRTLGKNGQQEFFHLFCLIIRRNRSDAYMRNNKNKPPRVICIFDLLFEISLNYNKVRSNWLKLTHQSEISVLLSTTCWMSLK